MVVEKGGFYLGECRIQPPAVVEPSVGNTQLDGATSTSEA
jgi:hypothetical protein